MRHDDQAAKQAYFIVCAFPVRQIYALVFNIFLIPAFSQVVFAVF